MDVAGYCCCCCCCCCLLLLAVLLLLARVGLLCSRVLLFGVVAGNLKVVVAIADILVVADCNLQWVLVCVNSAACD